jgi:hypothetical protein
MMTPAFRRTAGRLAAAALAATALTGAAIAGGQAAGAATCEDSALVRTFNAALTVRTASTQDTQLCR